MLRSAGPRGRYDALLLLGRKNRIFDPALTNEI
jgi:hypothetical protein